MGLTDMEHLVQKLNRLLPHERDIWGQLEGGKRVVLFHQPGDPSDEVILLAFRTADGLPHL